MLRFGPWWRSAEAAERANPLGLSSHSSRSARGDCVRRRRRRPSNRLARAVCRYKTMSLVMENNSSRARPSCLRDRAAPVTPFHSLARAGCWLFHRSLSTRLVMRSFRGFLGLPLGGVTIVATDEYGGITFGPGADSLNVTRASLREEAQHQCDGAMELLPPAGVAAIAPHMVGLRPISNSRANGRVCRRGTGGVQSRFGGAVNRCRDRADLRQDFVSVPRMASRLSWRRAAPTQRKSSRITGLR